MVPHTFLDGIWYSIGHPLHAKLTCQAQKVVQFFFPHLCLPEVDEVHHSCQGGVSESPHEDDRVRLVNLEQQVFEDLESVGMDPNCRAQHRASTSPPPPLAHFKHIELSVPKIKMESEMPNAKNQTLFC